MNVRKYVVWCNAQSLPAFLILKTSGDLFYYYWEKGKWRKSFLGKYRETVAFYLTVDDYNCPHILVQEAPNDQYIYFCKRKEGWQKTNTVLARQLQLIKWFIDQDKILAVGTVSDSGLELWHTAIHNPIGWIKVYEYPLNNIELLNIWFMPGTEVEFLTVEKADTDKLLFYNRLHHTGEVAMKSSITRLEEANSYQPILVRDTTNEAIIGTINNRLVLYKYSKSCKKWSELQTNDSLAPIAVEEILVSTGVVNSKIAFSKIMNMELEVPLIVSLDHLIRAFELNRVKTLGCQGIRRLGCKNWSTDQYFNIFFSPD